ncbi:polysaccharide deacetylase [Cohnella sp. CIP 111063]|uniref:polysaccharide deacetylase family protein n=1 Tax=unclassified Cohnella TaxID=2636738 RepID=UPI000B8BBCEC|nr:MULTISPECIES: polysaccharide deacetylase family protein [unclassified Cohnella]OXS57244.1 polysaccharide deacetylase [Cohnella sp. CIP 111063]PRX70681.1 peptidoglycan/xylan/chitin deacetylase (PgdA/CDA1 family) [Cohnella sp. SGD-V74]
MELERSPFVRQVRSPRKEIALTFDDGPDPVYTREVLSLLRQASGRATFFMIGQQMESYPDVVAEVAAEGHEIGNHTYSHPYLTRIGAAECREEIRKTQRLIRKLTGKGARLLRPPYLDVGEEVVRIAQEEGCTLAGAMNLEARDWEQPGASHIYERSLECAVPGSILLFHDGYGDRRQTVAAVAMLIEKLTGSGYKLVTASELIASATIEEGKMA